jgi:GxxExxY protein
MSKDVDLRRADFLVAGEIMVELKAIINLEDVHLAQAMNYLEAHNLQTGLLINLGQEVCNLSECSTNHGNRLIFKIKVQTKSNSIK